MIDKRSRYARTPTIEQVTADGEKRVLVDLRDVPAPAAAHQHVPAPGERLDHLAQRYYRDPRRYWRIADASDELDPFELVHPGEPLPVPPDT
jgi:nucleoid-associated protein YgaU